MQRILLKLSGEALAGDKKTGFDEDTVTSLLDSKWWELSDEEIRILSSEIQDPKAFIIKLNSIKK